MPDHQRSVHNRLAVPRAERGLSRRQFADKLGINYQTIGYIERGDYNSPEPGQKVRCRLIFV